MDMIGERSRSAGPSRKMTAKLCKGLLRWLTCVEWEQLGEWGPLRRPKSRGVLEEPHERFFSQNFVITTNKDSRKRRVTYWSLYYAFSITMNTVIQNQLDRVETALNTLITSIESYNPSVPAAIDLLTADTDLQEGVKQRKTSCSQNSLIPSQSLH